MNILGRIPGSRRGLLGLAAGFGAAALAGPDLLTRALAAPALVAQTGSLDKVRFTWNQSALCLISSAVAQDDGIFRKHGLDVDLLNFGGSTDVMLETIATGKADVGFGMILRWLKPLEQGFDVKLVAGIHAGCSYVVTTRASGITNIEGLRGKTIGIADISGTSRNLYAIMMQNAGMDPERDVTWKAYPDDVMPIAIAKGEIDAYVAGDPVVYYQVQASKGELFRLASNATGDWEARTCCVLGIRGRLIRENPDVATRIRRAILEAAQVTHNNPDRAVELALQYSPRQRTSNPEDVRNMLQSLPYYHQPIGDEFRAQVLTYAQELKRAGVLRPRTDPAQYTDRIVASIPV
jgi:NitT/TauT family transport system substrate-binding protein